MSQESSTQAPGLVTAVSPTGSVPEGSLVTVSYAVAPAVAPVAPSAPEATPVPASAPWPAVSESAAPGLGKLTVIFNANVDSSRVSADTFTLRDASDQPVRLAGVRVPAGRQNVVELTTAAPLAAGSYQLSVHGDGPAPLAGESGHVLDGDADGKPGGDMLIPFDVKAGDAR